MNINIIESNNRFSFDVRDEGKCIFSSMRDSITTSFLQPDYDHSWEACANARQLVEKHSFHLMHKEAYEVSEVSDAGSGFADGEFQTQDVSTKTVADFLTEHYTKVLKRLSAELRDPIPDEKEIFHRSLTSFVIELANLYQTNTAQGKKDEATAAVDLLKKFKKLLVSKFGGQLADVNIQALQQQLNPQDEQTAGGMPAMASRKTLVVTSSGEVFEKKIDEETIREILEDYAQQACMAIQDMNVAYSIDKSDNFCYININELRDKTVDKVLILRVNKLFHVDSVIPVGRLSKIYPFHSVEFYQKYWKPIIDSIGHFYLEDTDSLILTGKNEMPDLPKKDDSYSLESWDVSKKKLELVDIIFKGGDLWFFEKTPIKREASVREVSRYSEQDYLNAMVQCHDKNQPNLDGEIGQVIQVISLEDMIEVDVKFITFANEDNKIKKEHEESEDNIDGLVVRLSEDKLSILNNEQIASLNLGV